MKIILLYLIGIFLVQCDVSEVGTNEMHIIVDNTGPVGLDWLYRHGISVDKPVVGRIKWEITASKREIATLDRADISYDVIHQTNLPRETISDSNSNPLGEYHTYEELQQFGRRMTRLYPNIAKQFSIGKSGLGMNLLGIRITKFSSNDIIPKPKFKYVGNMHGDETVGREVLIRLIEDMLSRYGKDDRVTKLIDTVDIYILPSMNPDGFKLKRRTNYLGTDLNRNFPDRFGRQTGYINKETHAIIEWTKALRFTLSANLHGGDLVANYPFDGNVQYRSGVYTAAPDDTTFKHLARAYSLAHPKMKHNPRFAEGITNGADWYVLYGGMQDWNYLNTDNMELTMEISNQKYPSDTQLSQFWLDNKESLYSYMEMIQIGVRGQITSATTKEPIKDVIVSVQRKGLNGVIVPINHDIHTNNKGWYYRLLAPGTYTIQYSAPGYHTEYLEDIKVSDSTSIVKHVVLERL